MNELIVKVLLAYLIGSLVGALVVGRLYGGIDVRTEGSGNPGGTNALRTHGPLFALLVIAIDVGKGVLAAAWLPTLDLASSGFHPRMTRDVVAAICACAVVVGHVWPLFYRFRGGKGFATLLGATVALSPPVMLVMLAVWISVVLGSGYVGLASLVAAAAAPLAVVIFDASGPMLGYSLLMVLLIVFTHRGNLARMRRGTEHRFDLSRLLRRRG